MTMDSACCHLQCYAVHSATQKCVLLGFAPGGNLSPMLEVRPRVQLQLERAGSMSVHPQPMTAKRREDGMSKIKGNHDGPGGRNESYRVGSRPNVPRPQAVREVDKGQHPGYHTVKIEGRKYVRDNPDSSTKDNVND